MSHVPSIGPGVETHISYISGIFGDDERPSPAKVLDEEKRVVAGTRGKDSDKWEREQQQLEDDGVHEVMDYGGLLGHRFILAARSYGRLAHRKNRKRSKLRNYARSR